MTLCRLDHESAIGAGLRIGFRRFSSGGVLYNFIVLVAACNCALVCVALFVGIIPNCAPLVVSRLAVFRTAGRALCLVLAVSSTACVLLCRTAVSANCALASMTLGVNVLPSSAPLVVYGIAVFALTFGALQGLTAFCFAGCVGNDGIVCSANRALVCVAIAVLVIPAA